MRIVFCGNPEFALASFKALMSSRHQVVAVVTSPDKPRGRGRNVSPLPIKEQAQAAELPVFQPANLKDAEFLAQVQALAPDGIAVVAFRILPRELYALPRWGSFNVHPSLLPRGRGPAPIRWTLLRGETETGATIIHLSDTVDGGDILRQESTAVAEDENYGTLHDRLAVLGARLLIEVLDGYEDGHPPRPLRQDESQVTRAPKLNPADLEIHWDRPARDIRNQIRALSREQGAITRAGGQILKILRASETTTNVPLGSGQLLVENRETLAVGTGSGALRLEIVQLEGRRAMTAAEFLRGRPRLPDILGE